MPSVAPGMPKPTQSHVLVADDQPDVVEALRFLLKLNGYAVVGASSPGQVLEKLETSRFDLLVMDLNYARDTTSGREGLDLLDALRRLAHRPQIVVMTAWGSIPLAVEAMRRGAADFVTKPWDNSKLLATLEEQLRLRAAAEGQRPDEIAAELLEAVAIQRALLPKDLPRFAGFDVAFAWKPAHHVGGDYPDIVPLPGGGFAICLADVVGKGMPAALLMSNVQAAVRSMAQEIPRPSRMLERLSALVAANAPLGKFITAFYADVSPTEGRLRFSNAGHNPPFVVRKSGEVMELQDGGFVLGVFKDATYAEGEVSLHAGDRVVFYTDGLTEAEDHHSEQFGPERLQRLAVSLRGLAPERMQDELMAAASAWCSGRFDDDVTVITLGVDG